MITDAEIMERVEAWVTSFAQATARPDADIVTAIVSQLRGASRRWGPRSGAACGALLALVREAWGDPGLHVMPASDGQWYVWGGDSIVGHAPAKAKGSTEAAALLAALEASPL